MSLDYRPMLLSHQLFRETVPLRKPVLIYIDLAPRRIPIWYPEMSALYMESSLPES
jgi:hypothetical protein